VEAIYFTLIGSLWLTAWIIALTLITKSDVIVEKLWKPLPRRLVLMGVVLALPWAYLNSYPPAVALSERVPSTTPLLDLFVPAEWLVDHTPLRSITFASADVWNVRESLESRRADRLRRGEWGDWPPGVVALGCLVLTAIGVFLPPLIAVRLYRIWSPQNVMMHESDRIGPNNR
jgi:hypothetical protein